MNTSDSVRKGSTRTLPAGDRIEEFEILRVIGEGGFGIVYLARDHLLHRDVALKEYMPVSFAERGESR
nr:serine/threonine protein kinase [Burkholderiaceae bacterium]